MGDVNNITRAVSPSAQQRGPEKRTVSPISPRNYGSYATIGRLRAGSSSLGPASKQATAHSDSKQPPDGTLSPARSSPSTSTSASLLAYRWSTTMSASREASLLGAELDVLRERNSELQSKFNLAEAALKRMQRQHEEETRALQLELKQAKHDMEVAQAERQLATSVAASAVSEAECMRAALEEQFLSTAEENEAALKCCWLSRYWSLAAQLNVMPDIAPEKAVYWQGLAPPVSCLFQTATSLYQQVALGAPAGNTLVASTPNTPATSISDKSSQRSLAGAASPSHRSIFASSRSITHSSTSPAAAAAAAAAAGVREEPGLARSLLQATATRQDAAPPAPPSASTLPGPASRAAGSDALAACTVSSGSSGSGSAAAPAKGEAASKVEGGGGSKAAAESGLGPLGHTATAVDIVEIERAMREMWELGVPWACQAAMSLNSHRQRAALLQQVNLAPQEVQQALACPLGPEEQEEVQFLTAWLTFFWSQAALLGVAPQVAEERAVEWGQRMEQPPSTRSLAMLHEAFREMRARGVEQELWVQRSAGRAVLGAGSTVAAEVLVAPEKPPRATT